MYVRKYIHHANFNFKLNEIYANIAVLRTMQVKLLLKSDSKRLSRLSESRATVCFVNSVAELTRRSKHKICSFGSISTSFSPCEVESFLFGAFVPAEAAAAHLLLLSCKLKLP